MKFHIIIDTNQRLALTNIPAINKKLINTAIIEVYDNKKIRVKNYREWY